MILPRTCCMNVGGNKTKLCDEPAKHWYLHHKDICSFCERHNSPCGLKIIYCRVGTLPACYGVTDQALPTIEIGDRFKIRNLSDLEMAEVQVRCYEIKDLARGKLAVMGASLSLFMLEQW